MNYKKLLFKKSNIRILISLLILKVLLDFVYCLFISKVYFYDNFIVEFINYKYILSMLWFVIICISLPKNDNKPSSIILFLHFIIMILPIFTIYAFKNESNVYFNLVCSAFCIECILVKKLPTIKIYKIKNVRYIFYTLIGIITVLVYTSMIASNGIPTLDALNIYNVYKIRAEVNYPFLMNYLVVWQAAAINPLMIASSFYYKSYKTFLLFFSLQIVIYLITGHKTYLFISFAIIIIIYVLNKKNTMRLIINISIFGFIITYILYKFRITMILGDIFIRRFLFVPAQLKFYYYDFISQNRFLHYSEGVIGKIFGFESPYNMNFTNLIADVYFNKPNMSANTGYLGTGYANLGFTGVIIYVVVISIILKIIDSIGKKLDNALVTGIVLFPMLILNESDLLTTLLTGGLMILLILLYLFVGVHKKN